MLGGNDLRLALADNAEIEVMHGDHVWNLNDQDKEHLRNAKAKGTVGWPITGPAFSGAAILRQRLLFFECGRDTLCEFIQR
jgi:hypothetical protein